MFGNKPCPVCTEKDKRLEDAKEQIQYLRNLLNPPHREVPQYEPPNDVQADMILEGAGKEEVSLPQDENVESPEVLAERSAMLSGTY